MYVVLYIVNTGIVLAERSAIKKQDIPTETATSESTPFTLFHLVYVEEKGVKERPYLGPFLRSTYYYELKSKPACTPPTYFMLWMGMTC